MSRELSRKPNLLTNQKTAHPKPVKMVILNHIVAHFIACRISLKSLIQSPLTTLITLLAIGLSLTLPIGATLILDNAKIISTNTNQSTTISLYLNKTVSESKARALAESLAADDSAILQANYQTPEQSLKEFQNFSELSDIINLLDKNPLPGVITIIPHPDIQQSEALSLLQQQLQQLPEVDEAALDHEWLQKLHAMINFANALAFIISLIIGVGISVIVANTIRLVLEKHKDEILVLSLIGATASFIRRPFLYRGAIYGLLGGCISLVLVSIAISYLEAPAEQLAASYDSRFVIQTLSLKECFFILLGCISLGWIAARVALLLQWKALTSLSTYSN